MDAARGPRNAWFGSIFRAPDSTCEQQEPPEHEREDDDLECGEIDEPADVRRDRRHQADRRTAARAGDNAVHPAQHPSARGEHRHEREDDPRRTAIMQELVAVDRNEPDDREVDAQQRDQDRDHGGRTAVDQHRRPGVPAHLHPQPGVVAMDSSTPLTSTASVANPT
jgi:hypothetical protein